MQTKAGLPVAFVDFAVMHCFFYNSVDSLKATHQKYPILAECLPGDP